MPLTRDQDLALKAGRHVSSSTKLTVPAEEETPWVAAWNELTRQSFVRSLIKLIQDVPARKKCKLLPKTHC